MHAKLLMFFSGLGFQRFGKGRRKISLFIYCASVGLEFVNN